MILAQLKKNRKDKALKILHTKCFTAMKDLKRQRSASSTANVQTCSMSLQADKKKIQPAVVCSSGLADTFG